MEKSQSNGLFVIIPSLSHSIPEIRPVVVTVTISLHFPCKLGQYIVSLAMPPRYRIKVCQTRQAVSSHDGTLEGRLKVNLS